jgi:acetoacetate decarboxylase
LEYCDLENLINREQYYLDLLQPEYNVLKVAGSSLGFKHREESLAKVRLQLSKLNFEKGIKVEVTNSNSLYDRIKLTLYSALESCCSCRARAAPSLDGAIYGRQLY